MSATHRLTARRRTIASLDDALIETMWCLFERYYDGVERDAFLRDLRAKTHVLLLLDRDTHALAGFSTIHAYERTVAGRRVMVVFSGDTICDEKYWGQRALHSAFLRYVLRVKVSHPFTPLYWFLISKGYKTYLLLARNFPEYWPRHDRPTPAWQLQLLDVLARDKYGDSWRPERGILHFAQSQGRLRGGVAPIGAAELRDDHIRFFHERNPDATSGDELCCLGRIDALLTLNYLRRRVARLFRLRERRPAPLPAAVAETPS